MRQHHSGETWQEPSLIKKLWDLSWGLVLVAALTVLSEFGLHTRYSKTAPDAPAVSQPQMPVVK